MVSINGTPQTTKAIWGFLKTWGTILGVWGLGFLKIWGTILGGPKNEDYSILWSVWGPPHSLWKLPYKGPILRGPRVFA